jgi:hypothetical protein
MTSKNKLGFTKKIALLALATTSMGLAQAYDAQGGIVGDNETIGLTIGGSTFSDGHFHGDNGEPGFGFENYVISLSSITLSYLAQETTNGFTRYYLPGYTHEDPQNSTGDISTLVTWTQVPNADKQVYFGLATNDGEVDTVAFYVGDRENYSVPNSNTSYDAVAYVAVNGQNDASNPVVLSGTVNLTIGSTSTLNTASSGLTDGTNILTLITTVDSSAGTFSGSSTYNNSTGSADGLFYGSDAFAGNALASDGSYVASFGGTAK